MGGSLPLNAWADKYPAQGRETVYVVLQKFTRVSVLIDSRRKYLATKLFFKPNSASSTWLLNAFLFYWIANPRQPSSTQCQPADRNNNILI